MTMGTSFEPNRAYRNEERRGLVLILCLDRLN